MFLRLKQRINDIRTIKSMCLDAERHANADGEKDPGLEHFVLAALDLPDGTARRTFERLGADPDAFRAAIARQYDDALKTVGINTLNSGSVEHSDDRTPLNKGLYQAKPQVGALIRQLADRKKADATEPLLGAHLLEAVAAFQHGVASRAFAKMGIDRQSIMDAARAEADRQRRY